MMAYIMIINMVMITIYFFYHHDREFLLIITGILFLSITGIIFRIDRMHHFLKHELISFLGPSSHRNNRRTQ